MKSQTSFVSNNAAPASLPPFLHWTVTFTRRLIKVITASEYSFSPFIPRVRSKEFFLCALRQAQVLVLSISLTCFGWLWTSSAFSLEIRDRFDPVLPQCCFLHKMSAYDLVSYKLKLTEKESIKEQPEKQAALETRKGILRRADNIVQRTPGLAQFPKHSKFVPTSELPLLVGQHEHCSQKSCGLLSHSIQTCTQMVTPCENLITDFSDKISLHPHSLF